MSEQAATTATTAATTATTEAATQTTTTTPSATSSATSEAAKALAAEAAAKAADPAAATEAKPDAAKEGDLLFDEQKPDAEKKPLTADEQKAFLKDKLDPKDLEGKTDEEIAKLYEEQLAKDAGPVVDFAKITLPDGMAISEANQQALQGFITKHKLSPEAAQDAAQELADMGAKMQQEQLDGWMNMKKEWRTQVENDPELGGQNLKQTIADANAVIRKFAPDAEHLKELQQDLMFLGLGNKASFVRLLKNINAATKEDGLDGRSSAATAPQKNAAQRRYPNMKSEADA